ncbi:MAG: hypothetical protein ACXV7J_04355 [Methylomonas sp.]
MNKVSIHRLRAPVHEFVGKIGEHNVFQPGALHAVEDYSYYHTAEDSPDKLSYEQFADMTEGLFLMLCKLTNAVGHSQAQ